MTIDHLPSSRLHRVLVGAGILVAEGVLALLAPAMVPITLDVIALIVLRVAIVRTRPDTHAPGTVRPAPHRPLAGHHASCGSVASSTSSLDGKTRRSA